ncbi:hypothetical protein LCGC14_2840760, partial [marine sediment metagenome]
AEHEIIRDMESYGDVVRRAMQEPHDLRVMRTAGRRLETTPFARLARWRRNP